MYLKQCFSFNRLLYRFLLTGCHGLLLIGSSESSVIPLLYPGAGVQAMFGIGERFSMFLSDSPVDGYMLDIVQGNSSKFTSIELPDCRYVLMYHAHILVVIFWY